MQTRKNEVIQTITTSEQLSSCIGKYTSKRVLKTWIEDFVDEDTSEVIPIERSEILFDSGVLIDNNNISEMLFYLQSGDVKEIVVSNQQRRAYEALAPGYYVVTVDLGKRKVKILLQCFSIPIACYIINDYVSLNFSGGYKISGIRQFNTGFDLNDLEKEGDDVELKYYQVTTIVTNEDGYEYEINAVVKTIDLDRAKALIEAKLSQHSETSITTKIEEAKVLKIDYVIEPEFIMAYKE